MTPARRQLLRFCAVGASGYAVNLAVYSTLLACGVHYAVAATVSFVVATANNYTLNRRWTFRALDAGILRQSTRAFTVALLALGANQVFLSVFVAAGGGPVIAQAVASILVTPFSFVANKLWAFAGGGERATVGTSAPDAH
jgi:putative flippase GtrA